MRCKNLMMSILLLAHSGTAWAGACVSSTAPVAVCNLAAQGKIAFGSELPYYCNGSAWVPMCHSTSGGACTPGDIVFSGGIYKACSLTGATWFSLKGTTNGACSQAGKMQMVGTQLEYCDGALWYLF